MMSSTRLAAALLAFLFVAPALASPCAERIDAVSKQVQEEGREAISASSSGQADAASRGGQGKTGSAGEASQAPSGKAADAGKGADKAQAANVALDEARTLDAKGDAKGCDAAVDRAKKALSEAP